MELYADNFCFWHDKCSQFQVPGKPMLLCVMWCGSSLNCPKCGKLRFILLSKSSLTFPLVGRWAPHLCFLPQFPSQLCYAGKMSASHVQPPFEYISREIIRPALLLLRRCARRRGPRIFPRGLVRVVACRPAFRIYLS